MWPRPEIISALALAVSILSLGTSLYMAWRTAATEMPIAWITLLPFGREDCWYVNIHLRNRSKTDIRAHAVTVPIDVVPITKKQKFWMVELHNGVQLNSDGEQTLAPDVENKQRTFKSMFSDTPLIVTGETRVFNTLLFRSSISAATSVKMTFAYQVMKSKPFYRKTTLTARIPSGLIEVRVPSS